MKKWMMASEWMTKTIPSTTQLTLRRKQINSIYQGDFLMTKEWIRNWSKLTRRITIELTEESRLTENLEKNVVDCPSTRLKSRILVVSCEWREYNDKKSLTCYWLLTQTSSCAHQLFQSQRLDAQLDERIFSIDFSLQQHRRLGRHDR